MNHLRYPNMEKPLLLGLYSPVMGAGKSTVAGFLRDEWGFEVISFAGPLKKMVRSLMLDMGLPEDAVEEAIYGSMKEFPIPGLNAISTPRLLMQTLGTDWGRGLIDPEIWVKVAIRKAISLMDKGISVVIDDVRFENEFHTIYAQGGSMVKVVRPGAERTNSHPSEGLLDGYVFSSTINNSGDEWMLSELTTHALCEIAGEAR